MAVTNNEDCDRVTTADNVPETRSPIGREAGAATRRSTVASSGRI
jgi:hypothetical protein